MKCQHCGVGNPDTAKFCRKCGKPVMAEQPKPTPKQQPASELRPEVVSTPQDTICPHCGQKDCQPMMRSITNIKTSGYSWSSGCCGMLFMGPFGLLCGLCGIGSKVDTKSETIWICKNCGKEHLSQKSALDKAQATAASYVMTILLGALFLSAWYSNGGLTWLIPFAWAFSPLVAWYIMDDELSKELGYPFKEILSPGTSVASYLLIAEISTVLVLLFGGPLVIDFLSGL